MRRINKIQDVVDWGLCTGCGACYSACGKGAVSFVNIESMGIIPKFRAGACAGCNDCLSSCPGYAVDSSAMRDARTQDAAQDLVVGPAMGIWEGYAADAEIRFSGSSGGALTALALYCLEREGMRFVSHTAMDPSRPLMNFTVQSGSRTELLSRTGSRYAPSSPCDGLRLIEESDRPCVFIGRPCDAAAVMALRRSRPGLDRNLGLVLTFFCAGPPCTKGTLDLLASLDIDPAKVRELRYRGNGWPGEFKVVYGSDPKEKVLTYKESWGFLAKRHRSMRCHICPDGLGEIADISCGDAWHRYTGEGDIGRSLVLARSSRGRDMVRRAMAAGYLTLERSSAQDVVRAQGLVARRGQAFGRLFAMKALMLPVPRFKGFRLFEAWLRTTPAGTKLRTVLGTLRRLILRGLWHRNPVFQESR